MGLHVNPALRCQILLLQDKADLILLLVRQGIVAGEALRDVHARGLGIAAHLQHVAVEVGVNPAAFAVARVIGDQEAVEGIVLLIIGVRSVLVSPQGP